MKHIALLSLLVLLALSCEEEKLQSEIDDEIIQDYVTTNNIDATKHTSGMYYVITKEGIGEHPGIATVVEVKYKGYLTNGNVFDATTDNENFKSELYRLIQGWQIGIPLLKIGGKGTFFIPSHLGYGDRAAGTIPANSVLIFDIELIDFKDLKI